MSRKELEQSDIELFRETIGAVKPVKNDRADRDLPRPMPVPVQAQRHEQEALQDLMSDRYDPAALDLGSEISFLRPGLQHNLLRRLKRGHYSIGAALDLHGLTVPKAKQAVITFLQHARQAQKPCVRIIHGKGLRSSNAGPILKPMVAKWLAQRQEVLAFCTARPVDGGSGAVYVLLKK
jgi:DNA-nicking Smr family endonuclease